ncbi:MAG TPA: hypothetical protein VM890_00385 [Longimicrobium sp.]|nr:hypothetical protein [Longimicrobium sp.]
MILRCTQRLLKGVGLPIVADPSMPEAALGEWYANVVALPFTGRWLVMYTSASTLLTVVAPGRAVRTTLPVFRERLPRLLRRLGLPDEWVDAQARAAEEVIIARTNNRRVLGSMDDLAGLAWFVAEEHRTFQTLDLDELELALSRNLLGMIGNRQPADVAAELARAGPSA